jgi:hypothetical protein
VYEDRPAIQRDIANFRNALGGVQVTEAFLPPAAPGSVEPTMPNEYYPSDEAYGRGRLRASVLHVCDASIPNDVNILIVEDDSGVAR